MHFFKITLKNSIVYRWSAIFSILGSVLFIAINTTLWRFLFQDDGEMVSYMTKYTIISNIISMSYTRGIANRIGEKVSSGAFVTDLIRPINLFAMSWQMELGGICANFILHGLPVILVYLPLLITSGGYYNIPVAIMAVALGHVLFLLVYSLLGFSAFILIEIWPFGRLLDDTIRLLAGGFIPLAVLPAEIRNIAEILPFRFLYSFPLELLFGKMNVSEILSSFAMLLVWVIIFGALNFIMYRLALRKAVVQGG